MKCHKMTKLGIVLASMTVLGTLQALPSTIVPILGSQVVRAEEESFFNIVPAPYNLDTERIMASSYDEISVYELKPGESITLTAPTIEGYSYEKYIMKEAISGNTQEGTENTLTFTRPEYSKGNVNYLLSWGFRRSVEDPKDPNQDPSDNNNANTGGGANDGGSVGTPSTPDNGATPPSNGDGNQGGQADGSANGGETTPVTPPTSNEGETTPAPTQPENGNPGTANPAPEQPNTGNAGTATPGDNANANPPATSDNTSGNQGTEQPEKPEATPETPTQPEKPDTPATPSTPTPETKPSDGKVEDTPSTGNASANTGDSGKADAVGNSGNADLNTGTTVTPNTGSQSLGNTSVRPPANKSDALTTVPSQTTPAPSAIGTDQTLPVTVDYADSKDKAVNPSQPSDTSNPSSIAQPQTLSRVESRHLPKTNDTGSLFAWLGFALVGTGLGLKRRRG